MSNDVKKATAVSEFSIKGMSDGSVRIVKSGDQEAISQVFFHIILMSLKDSGLTVQDGNGFVVQLPQTERTR